MAVLRSQRSYPLVLKNDPLNVGIVAAYDWASENDSTDASNGRDHSGNNRHWSLVGAPAIVQTNGGKARDTSLGGTTNGTQYTANGAVSIGLDVGLGDFTIWRRIRMPTSVPTANNIGRKIFRLTDGSGERIVINVADIGGVGWRWSVLTSGVMRLTWNAGNNPTFAAGAIADIHLTRIAGILRIYVNGVLITTLSDEATSIGSTTGGSKTIIGNYSATDAAIDAAIIDDVYWNRGLIAEEVAAHSGNPYSFYDNQAPANAIAITQPTTGATAGASFAVAGTYSGGDSPGAIEASFNGGAWVVIDPAPAGGNYSGTLANQAPGVGALSVRWSSIPAVTASVANITVATAGIAFTVPSRQQSAAPYRMFQRDAQNRAQVRVSGTYTGTVTAIQYRWKGGAWTTLDAAPSAGVFDKTVTLQGPDQGDLEVRFANATGVTAMLPKIGVGDVFLTLGQSNNVGMSAVFVEPQAPAAHPDWIAIKLGKDGVWRRHREIQADPYDDRTNAQYPAQANGATPFGSYFGALATRIMATGVPVAFVPCALGSSSLSQWAIGTSTTTLYGAALARSADVGDYRAVIWWQGEAEAAGTASLADLVAAYGSRVNDWFTRTGKKWFVWAINDASTGSNFENVHAALLEVGKNNPNSAGSADLKGSFTGDIHYQTGPQINDIAGRAFAAMNAAYGYTAEPPADATAPAWPSGATLAVSGITTSTATVTAPAATDNTAVSGYQISINGGESFSSAPGRIVALAGLPAGTLINVQMRAFDAALNYSAPLARSFTTLAEQPPGQDGVDGSKIADSRRIVFPGGTRVVPFGTRPAGVMSNAPSYENGKWWCDKHPSDERYWVADLSVDLAEAGSPAVSVAPVVAGITVLEQPVIQGALIPIKLGGLDLTSGAVNYCTFRVNCANGEQFDRTIWFRPQQGKWELPKDPEDKRFYVADIENDLVDSNTTATAATAIPVGVAELVAAQVQGNLIVVKLGGMDTSPDPTNYCTLRIDCANGERFYRTIHFTRVDN